MRVSVGGLRVAEFDQPEVVYPKLAADQWSGRLASNFHKDQIGRGPGTEARLLLMPGIAAQQIVGHRVRGKSISVTNGEARTTGAVNVLCLRLGAKRVIGIGLDRNQLRNACIGRIAPVEGD